MNDRKDIQALWNKECPQYKGSFYKLVGEIIILSIRVNTYNFTICYNLPDNKLWMYQTTNLHTS
mgnify:CR=1 FL=1